MAVDYSKWDALDVSDSEEEQEDDSASGRAALAQQHRELTEAAAAQQRLRELINEHKSGKPLEPPEEVRDILDAPLWCDEPLNISAPSSRYASDAPLHEGPTPLQQEAAAARCTDAGDVQASTKTCAATAPASAGSLATVPKAGRRRDFADWDKLKLDDSDEEGARVDELSEGRVGCKPPAEVEKLRQLMQA
jgi:hypothetical protein